MPELPEVETVVRGLRTYILGKTITKTTLVGSPTFRSKIPSFLPSLKSVTVADVRRHGKSIFLDLTQGPKKHVLHVHLGMTGQLLWQKSSSPRLSHTHVIFHLEKSDFDLRYRDIRRFGQLHLNPSVDSFLAIPDAWVASEKELAAALSKKDVYAKHALLNQKYLVGLGNIYVDESLFLSKIHPKRRLSRVPPKQLADLCAAIKKVLKTSIELGGTSFSNYVDVNGGRGGFKRRLHVYGKAGEPCAVCQTPIKKIVFAGRGTHFCPSCQPHSR